MRGNVGTPSRRSAPGIFPVSIVSPTQSRMSSAIWNAVPSASPKAPRRGSRDPSRQAASQCLLAIRGGQVDEQRSQSLAASSDGVATDGPDHARIALDGRLEPLLELVEIRLRLLENRLRLRRHGRTPVCSATLPPPSNRYLT